MIQNHFVVLFFFLGFLSCNSKNQQDTASSIVSTQLSSAIINPSGTSIKTRINCPENYSRITPEKGSFAAYLQNFPLKSDGSKVYLFDGRLKNRQDIHTAVLDIDVGNRDLQQCADATMRLKAEYLYSHDKFEEITFNFTNGFKASYSKWRQGYRIKVQGNNVFWVRTDRPSKDRSSFRHYLNMVFSYAGTLSLSQELPIQNIDNIQIGDLFIQGGSPGHAIIVVDLALNNNGEKIILLAQSYMPAQDIHILKNFNNIDISPWYNLHNINKLVTPEWVFNYGNLRKFQ